MSMEQTDRKPDPRDWIGRTQEVPDTITCNLASRIAVTLGRDAPLAGAALPPLWHWAYFQDMVPEAGLGPDGHPARGGFLPPADDRNRMWAGGDVAFLEPLVVDRPAVRRTTVEDVQEKSGRTSSLLFVAVRHEYSQDGRLCISERQDIVYRTPSPPRLRVDASLPPPEWSQTVTASETLLFRYSAVTFNTHRIHYDYPYVTQSEGYAGIVVHGPLIATLLCQAFIDAHPAKRITRFTYRGVRPLTVPQTFSVAGRLTDEGAAALWAANENGPAQTAELRFV